MPLTLAEGLVGQVLDHLEARFPVKLGEIEADYGDGLVLPAPAEYHLGEFGIGQMQQFPVILAWVEDGKVDRLAADFLDVAERLRITVVVLDQDPADLERKIYRYVRAILELMMEGNVSNAIEWRMAGGDPSWTYSPVFTRATEFLKDASFRCTMRKQEVK